MTYFRYILRSIVHYRRQHLALFSGMAVSAAILTGALIVGDSIQYSLNQIVDTRLGRTRFSVNAGSRFFTTNLAANLHRSLQVPVTPLMMLKGIVIDQGSGNRVNNAGIIGIDSTINGFSISPVPIPGDDEAVISSTLADRLHVKPGDELLVRVENVNPIPVNSPFARESGPTVGLRLTIMAVADDDQLGRLNLANNQSTVYNVFLSISFLSARLNISGKANILLVAGDHREYTPASIADSIQEHWSLKDMGLKFDHHGQKGIYDLVSDRIFIDTIIQQAIMKASLPGSQIITYLVNDIGHGKKHIPYSFASGISPSLTGEVLNDNEAIINRWSSEDLGAVAGDSVRLTYFTMGPLRNLLETESSFLIKKVIDNTTDGIDSSLMPAFQGLSGVKDCREWDAGVPIDFKRIRDKDEKYWDEYRGTPKVILSLNEGKRIWKNPFGAVTALRFIESEVSEKKVAETMLRNIRPSGLGIRTLDMRESGLRASKNAVDFTGLFMGMSFFIIVAGVLLTVLIYSLHFSRRSVETALLGALGFRTKNIIWLRFAEASLVILIGSLAGSLLGIIYNYAMLAGLNSVWNDMVRTDLLKVHVTLQSLVTGIMGSIIIALLPIYLVTVKKMKQPVAARLKEIPDTIRLPGKTIRSFTWGAVLTGISFLLTLYALVTGALQNAALYLSSAGLFLAGSLLMVYGKIKSKPASNRNPISSEGKLAVRNLRRNPSRSLSVVILLALGTFTVILTGAYRRTFYGTDQMRSSGTGGYLLWAETTSPIPFKINSQEGYERLITDSIGNLNGVTFLQFSKLEGDEASCLNLNQAQTPQLLAVDAAAFDSSGAFSFVKLLPEVPVEHPWKGLDMAINDTTYPAFVDQTVLQYSLKKKTGDTLVYHNESGRAFRLVLAGSLDNSVFQGYILVSDNIFRKQYPSHSGSRVILTDASEKLKTFLTRLLSRSFTDYGIEVTSTSQRLATFNSVENTYLTVFMVLSGLGFLIGTIGLGIVLLRNVYERRQELALLLSLGFKRHQVFMIVFIENIYLLLAGFGIGLFAAFVGILPSLFSPSFNIQGVFLMILSGSIFISGLLWIYFPLRSVLRRPLILSLRND
jgi:putative ABC transport system permease protein